MNSKSAGYLLVALGILMLLGAGLNWRIISRLGRVLNLLLSSKDVRAIDSFLGDLFFAMGISQLTGINW
jgi:hypothetical protein